MRKRTLPSKSAQLEALKKKGIVTKKGINPGSGRKVKSAWTIYRLYKFYIKDKHSLDEPIFKAYSQRKRLYQRLEKNPEKATIATPRGKKTGVQYIRLRDESTIRRLSKRIPSEATMRYGKYYSTVKHVRDEFSYRIRPPITANAQTLGRAEQRAERVQDAIVSIIKEIFRERRELYGNHAMGAIIAYHTNNVETQTGITNPTGYIRVPWVRLPDIDFFGEQISIGFDTAFSIIHNYPGGSVSLYRVDVYISTLWRGTNVDMARIRT